jgi:MoaA/NifB/PqqE/SkfB family radical SAM enzyme
MISQHEQTRTVSDGTTSFDRKLWIYTNFDCNIECSYCVAESTRRAPRRGLDQDTVKRLVDEAVEMGFEQLFLTGGEPFILDDIYEMLAYASSRLPTTVLTNGMLLRGKRLVKLWAINNKNLVVQVSLDGGRPEHHDPYRGEGTWAKTVEGIRALQERGIRVRLSTTETAANIDHLDILYDFRSSLNISEDDHFVRPMAHRGFAQEGQEVGISTLIPEITVTADGIYWHPLVSPSSTDMRVSQQIFPLAAAVDCVEKKYAEILNSEGDEPESFT